MIGDPIEEQLREQMRGMTLEALRAERDLHLELADDADLEVSEADYHRAMLIVALLREEIQTRTVTRRS